MVSFRFCAEPAKRRTLLRESKEILSVAIFPFPKGRGLMELRNVYRKRFTGNPKLQRRPGRWNSYQRNGFVRYAYVQSLSTPGRTSGFWWVPRPGIIYTAAYPCTRFQHGSVRCVARGRLFIRPNNDCSSRSKTRGARPNENWRTAAWTKQVTGRNDSTSVNQTTQE